MRLSHLFFFILALSSPLLAQDTSFSAGPQYLVTNQLNQFLRPIATPSLSLDAPLPSMPSLPEVGAIVEDQPYITTLRPSEGPDLFPIYYGYPEIPVVELVTEAGSAVPPVPVELNTVAIVPNAAVVHTESGDTLGEIASGWRARRTPLARIYTNSDIELLRAIKEPATVARAVSF